MKETTPKGKRFYSIKEIQEIFGFSRSKALSLVKTHGFPTIRIGRSYYVDSLKLDKWIEENYGKNISVKDE